MLKKVLLVEDDAFLIRFYKAKLEQKKFQTVSVEDGGLANQTAKEEQPDVIVLDVMLPNKNGFEILKDLKKDSATEKIPVIVFTKLSQESDKKELTRLGCQAYMVKTEHKLDDLILEIEKITMGGKA